MADYYDLNPHMRFLPGETAEAYTSRIASLRNQGQGTRDLALNGGDSAASLLQGQQSSSSVAQSVPNQPYQQFGLALMNLLQRSQKLGTKPFVEQGLNAQQEQVKRTFNTPKELIGAAPGVQSGVRNAAVNALNPIVQGAENSARTFSEQISGFNTGINTARGILSDYQSQQDKARDDARNAIKDALTIGGADSLKGLNHEELLALEKAAGYPKNYLEGLTSTLKEREIELKRQLASEKSSASGLLSMAQRNSTINSIAQSFDNEPTVKQYNTIAETVDSVKNSGITPTDDIQRIYAFAKVMDPTSAVKEGEYETIQKYATSLLQRYGLNAKRVFTNSGFLTDEARNFILNSLNNRLASSRTSYDNTFKQYQQRIDKVNSGQFNSLTDYGQAFPQSTTQGTQPATQAGSNYQSTSGNSYVLPY